MNHLLAQVPGWLQGFCVFIILLFVVFLFMMLREVRVLLSARYRLMAIFDSIPILDANDYGNGLSLEHLDRLRQEGLALTGIELRWWNRIEANIQRYSASGDREGWFTVVPFHNLLPKEDLEAGFHAGLYQSVPAWLTGLGLLGTFMALLFGLLNLEYTEAAIKGLKDLINNLSGKFLSSVIALVLSLLFLLIEKIACEQRFAQTYDQIASKFEQIIPSLSSTQVLIDIQLLQVKQTTSLGNISSDLVDRFVGVFKADLSPMLAAGISHEMARELQTEFRPTMAQMTEILVQVKETIQRVESNKQESVVEELHGLIETLQLSITEALSEMGTQFHQQLTGATHGEFDNVQSTLSGTTLMLEKLNAVLGEVIEGAKQSTSTQIASGKEQVAALTQLMEGLITRLNDSTDKGLQNISATLTVVVDDLSKKVAAVSDKMLDTITETTIKSQTAATKVIQSADDWTEANAKRLEALVGSIELRSRDFNEAGASLLKTNESLKNTLLHNQNALDSLAKASEQVRFYITSLSGLAKTADEIEKSQFQTSTQVKQTVEDLRRISNSNSLFLDEYKKIFSEYKGVFEGLDSQIANALLAINQGMGNYFQAVENNFRTIVNVTNQHLPQISITLKTQITELEGQLEELSDVLDKGLKGLR